MKNLDFIFQAPGVANTDPVFVWGTRRFSQDALRQRVETAMGILQTSGVSPESVVLLEGDFTPSAVACLLAAIALQATIVPLLPATIARNPKMLDIADPDFVVVCNADEPPQVQRREAGPRHEILQALAEKETPGLILFTSGSTGEPKAVVHDFAKLLRKFDNPRPALRTLCFLQFDHWGGLNTLLHCLSSGSLIVFLQDRQPANICVLIEEHGLELLPTTPSFLNLLLLSRAHRERDLSSLKIISYGAEPMPKVTLERMSQEFPAVSMRQTYGMIEIGVLRAKSVSNESLWVKVGGDGYAWRIVDGILQIKADSAMLGYLNADALFTEDGYFITGDKVEQDGENLRFLGRASELINVGGEKVLPIEVENVLLGHDAVADAVVYGERNPVMGQIVCAEITLADGIDGKQIISEIKQFCRERLDKFKVPVRLTIRNDSLLSDRMKRQRPENSSQ
jgi:long-chain acyl-CoA synthetase